MIISAHITNSGSVVHVGWKSGDTARFHSVWLRDNSLDPTTRNADNGQRLITIREINPSISVGRVEIVGDGDAVLMTFAPTASRPDFQRGGFSIIATTVRPQA